MLTMQNIEAELSYAYLHAVASRAGFICECTGRHSDEAGIDAVIRARGALATDSVLKHFTVDVQLKASAQALTEQDGVFSFPLPIKNYDELRSLDSAAPQILIILSLPENPEEWLTHSEDNLIAKRCAYWASLRSAPPTTNRRTQTVYLPRSQVLSSGSLRALLTRFSRREVIDYEP